MPQRIEMGKKYRTRDGRPARILAVDLKGANHGPLVLAAITNKSGNAEDILRFSQTGRYEYWSDNPSDTKWDLFEVKPEVTGWVNVYRSGRMLTEKVSNVYITRKLAEQGSASGRIACIPITFTEGDGLDEDPGK